MARLLCIEFMDNGNDLGPPTYTPNLKFSVENRKPLNNGLILASSVKLLAKNLQLI